MDDKTQQQNQESDDIKRELDKDKTLNDPGKNVVDYGRSEQDAVQESREDGKAGEMREGGSDR